MATPEVFIAQTTTGRIVEHLDVSSGTVSDALGGQGSQCSLSIPVRRGLRAQLAPWRSSVVIADGEDVWWAGPITAPTQRTRGGLVQVSASSPWTLLARRPAFLPGAAPPSEAADLVVTQASPAGVVTALIGCALSWGPLPIVTPTTGLSGRLDGTWPSYDLGNTAGALRGLVDLDAGQPIETHLEPRWAGGHDRFEWVARIGDPVLRGQDHVWDTGSAAVTALVETGPADTLSTRAWVSGDGQERGRVIGYAAAPTLEGLGWPALHDFGSVGGSSDDDQRDVNARALARVTRRPKTSLTPVVDPEGYDDDKGAVVAPRMGEWRIGDTARFDVTADPWTPDGSYRGRITGWSYTYGKREVALMLDADPADLDPYAQAAG